MLASNEIITFNVPNFFAISEPLNNLLFINKKDNLPFKVKKINIKFKYKVAQTSSDWYDFEINKQEIDYINNEFAIVINDYFNYDILTNQIEQIPHNSFKGIFIPKNVIGTIEFNMIFEYKNMIRKVIFDRQFSFNNEYYQNSYDAILCSSYNYNLTNYKELIYGF